MASVSANETLPAPIRMNTLALETGYQEGQSGHASAADSYAFTDLSAPFAPL
jgi:hypothetical protein